MTTTPTRRARIKAKSPEEFERWRELAEKQKCHHEGEFMDDTSSLRSEHRSVA